MDSPYISVQQTQLADTAYIASFQIPLQELLHDISHVTKRLSRFQVHQRRVLLTHQQLKSLSKSLYAAMSCY